MSNKPRNKWIQFGLTTFIGFLLVMAVGFMTMDIRLMYEGELILLVLSLVLQAVSFSFSFYGLLTMDKEKESGSVEAVVVIVIIGVFAVLQISRLIG